jgi:DNA sulfur modification protein DndD
MKLIKLGLKNYGIYCGEHNIDFSIEEKGKNVILIGGANGRGKTTILEAIMLALYGKRSIAFNDANMSYSAYLEKYINKTSTDNETAVELVFSLIESKEESTIIKIRRSWEHGRPRTADKVEVWCNSVKDEHLAKYWDVYVEEILPSGITSLFFFDNEKIGRLALEDTGEEVKQSIKALLGINVIDNLVSDLKRIITKKQDEDTAIRDNKEINEKKAELLSIEDSLARLRQAKSQYMQKLAKLQKDLHEKETEFLQKGGRLGESRASLIKDKEVITNELISEKEKLVGISAGAAPLMLVLPILERIRKSAQRDDDIKAAKYANKIISKLKDKFIKQLEGMDIEGKDKFEIIKVFNSELDRIRELESKDQIHNLSPISMSLIDSLISGGFRDIARSTVACINRIKELQNDLGQIERHLLVEVDEDETNALLKDIKSTSKKIVNLEHEMQQNEEEIARLEKDRTNIENELMGLMKKVMDEQCKQMEVKSIIISSQDLMKFVVDR